ncbi:unnamed protein product [Linum tenue]|uniref:Uncharacterized protein n=2 Tax=Linum tenue TaxID=586396 RepID=A0AAV0L908_9ROSI|nr:unnamed protein product [Linum tenue]
MLETKPFSVRVQGKSESKGTVPKQGFMGKEQQCHRSCNATACNKRLKFPRHCHWFSSTTSSSQHPYGSGSSHWQQLRFRHHSLIVAHVQLKAVGSQEELHDLMQLLKEYKGKLAKVAGSNSPPRQFYVYALCGFVRAQVFHADNLGLGNQIIVKIWGNEIVVPKSLKLGGLLL